MARRCGVLLGVARVRVAFLGVAFVGMAFLTGCGGEAAEELADPRLQNPL